MTPRDYSAVMRDGKCVICGQPRRVPDAHQEIHLARGEAIVDSNRVIPTPTDDGENRPAYSGTRRLDPILARLVRAEQRKQNRSR